MQATGTGTKVDVSGLSVDDGFAVPQAGAAENTLFAIECRDAVFSAGDGLA
jgi:hypothetical protein